MSDDVFFDIYQISPSLQSAVKSLDDLPDDVAIIGDYTWVKMNSDLVRDFLAADLPVPAGAPEHSVWWDEDGGEYPVWYVADAEGDAGNYRVLHYQSADPSKAEVGALIRSETPFALHGLGENHCRGFISTVGMDDYDWGLLMEDTYVFMDSADGILLYL